jgi:haloacetate dehalogenase
MPAGDVVSLMRRVRHERFAVVGHDRGSCVAMRTALDHPDAVTRLAVLDCVPIVEHLERADARFAAAWWHWFFFTQPEKPERAILADPAGWYGALAPGKATAMGERNHADHLAAISDRDTVRAMLEDYRAGLTVDRTVEDLGGRSGGRPHPIPRDVILLRCLAM